MPVNWKALARVAGHKVVGDQVILRLANGRRQAVNVDASASDVLRIWTVILYAAKAQLLINGDALAYAWQRNRLSDLLGFTVDARGRLVSEAWVPHEQLTAAEFDVYLREVARVSDYHEMRLTGIDEQ